MKILQKRPSDMVNELARFLDGYDPTKLLYLNRAGEWSSGPRTMRDRISNELWHRFWQLNKENDQNREFNTIFEILSCRGYDILSVFESPLSNTGDSREMDVLSVCETLYRLIEYEALNINSRVYVTDWDNEGKKQKMDYVLQVQKFLSRYDKMPDSDRSGNIFIEILGRLREKSIIFNDISQLIAEEDRVRNSMENVFKELINIKDWTLVYSIISEKIHSSIAALSKIQGALLRPSLDILTNQEIDITSGLQYDASDILGSLVDVRATDVIIQVLGSTALKHTNIRSNLIYALGNLRQSRSLPILNEVLNEPESTIVYLSNGTQGYEQTLRWEKNEAVWALGKMGEKALPAMPMLIKQLTKQNRESELALAWTMGMIGSAQKEMHGGIDASIVTTLMNLITSNDGKVLEEVAYSLRRLGLPDFLHSLYFHNTATLPLIALKTSSSGLYELSETIFHQITVKKPVVLAVTGDSGTGKTFFCECIKDGFGDIKKEEILYLMRDNPGHMYIFNRMMGIRLMKEFFDPEQYQDYPYNEDEDDPRSFFIDFIEQNSNKKLIILDGWMDETYFYQVLKIFYLYGHMDIIVNFRTTYSTKRLNLEDREGSLENIKTCLSYIERPVIEETEFYRNGDVLIYNLDNSVQSRLTKDQIREIFAHQKVEGWGEYIKLGDFKIEKEPLKMIKKEVGSNVIQKVPSVDHFVLHNAVDFSPDEARFNRILNDDRKSRPYLLNKIEFPNNRIKNIEFFTQGQLAFGGYDGSVGILSGFNDRVLHTIVHKTEVMDVCVVGADICSVDAKGDLKITSFDKKTIIEISSGLHSVNALGTDRNCRIVTGHADGSIMLWDLNSKEVKRFVHEGAVITCITVDRAGVVYAGTDQGEILVLDLLYNAITIIRDNELPIRALTMYPGGKIVTAVENRSDQGCGLIRILDTKALSITDFIELDKNSVSAIYSYFDGRIIAGIGNRQACKLRLYDLRRESLGFIDLGEHGTDIRDCAIIGPRIITCGTEKNGGQTLRLWGTSDYIAREWNKLRLMSETMIKPSYYRTLF